MRMREVGLARIQSVFDRGRKQRPQRRDASAHGVAGEPKSDQLADEAFDVARLDLGQLHGAEEGQRVPLEVASVLLSCLFAEAAAGAAGVACDPFREVLGEGDTGEGAIFAAGDLGGERRPEQACLGERGGGAITRRVRTFGRRGFPGES
jgi:hypothetical protein